jgi:hypothetical protein
MTVQTYPAPKSQVTSSFWRYTATGGETTLTGTDNAGVSLAYLPGQEQVFLNGVMLVRGTDYTATNGTSIAGLASLTAGDYVQVTTYSNFTINQVPVSSLQGSVSNLQLANSSLTIGSTLINLGDTKSVLAGLTLTAPTINNQIAGTQYSTSVPLTVKGAAGQAVNLQEWNINGGSALAYITSSGALTLGSPQQSGGLLNIGGYTTIGYNNQYTGLSIGNLYASATQLGINYIDFRNESNVANASIFANSYTDGSADLVFYGSNAGSRTSDRRIQRMAIDVNGNFNIGGSTSNNINGLRYLDIYNQDGTTTGSGTIIRLITQQSASTALTTVDMVKYKNGTFVISNNDSAATTTFNTAGSERMRIDSSGRVGIATTNLYSRLNVSSATEDSNSPVAGTINSSTTSMFISNTNTLYGILFKVNSTGMGVMQVQRGDGNTSLYDMQIQPIGGNVLIGYTTSNGAYKLQVNSQIFATSSSIATSDGRFKENVNTINNGLQLVDALNPVSFNWKKHDKHNFVEGKTVGFIAQEVREALKDYEWVNNVVKENKDGETGEEFLGLVDSAIIPLLVSAVKELSAKVKALEAK